MVVLFDIDGTLMDHSVAERAAAAALHTSLKRKDDPDDFVRLWAAVAEKHHDRYLAGELSFAEQRRARVREIGGAELLDEETDAIFRYYLEEYERSWSLFEDAIACLDALSHCRLGVITNGDREQQRKKLGDALGRFEHVVTSSECGHAKPSPEIFQKACELFECRTSDAFYVGDRYDVDAEGARGAGLTGIWLDRSRVASEGHAPPILSGLDELVAYLGAQGA